ncbi:MAG: Hsp20/alpha crystallin family protein [Candidatus Micrarchaeota archaeon]|nr:Hsp20/alpha crystallin family protein [Candidatus Micrarchaeota archaeon]
MAKKNKGRKAELIGRPFFPEFGGLWSRSLFDEPAARFGFLSSTMPRLDMVDEGDSLQITADLPGIRKEDIKVNVTENSLAISAKTRKESEERGKNYYYNERSSSGYYRRVSLPANVDPKSVKAKFENGSLLVTLKKKAESGNDVSIE